jgi:hypothetical protein
VLVAFAIIQVVSYLRGPTPGDPSASIYVDSQTGQAFLHKNVVGDTVPVHSPYTGANTGYPGVPCYWTASGEVKKDPDWVIMNYELGKPGPTFCPVCGRLVVPRAPLPRPGDRPPPTQQELLHSNPAAFGSSSGR